MIHEKTMAGKAILTCMPNSHPFNERTLILDLPVKIGRAVARSRVAPSNAIFDCKVLSRNHAVLWYTNGKFYLQDTKSSNGTFVNNERLSKSGVESLPREVKSGDVVQFGVNVVESSRKVNHGCIVANLKLFLPDGKETKASDSPSISSCPITEVISSEPPFEQLYDLHRLLTDAVQRELVLERQLVTLQAALKHVGEEVGVGWKSLIAEDRLLMRIDALEDQLNSKNLKDHEELREEIAKLHMEKNTYEQTAKERVQKAIVGKMMTEQQLHETKRSLGIMETQYKAVTTDLEKSREQIQDLTQIINEERKKTEEATAMMRDMEEEYKERIQRHDARIQELQEMFRKSYPDDSSIERHPSSDMRIPTLNNDVDSFLLRIKKEENESDESNDDIDNCKNNMLLGLKNKEASDLLSDVTEFHLESKHEFEKRCIVIDEKIESLENELREGCTLKAFNNTTIENGVSDNDWDPSQNEAKELEMEQLKDEREEMEIKIKKCEINWNRAKEDLERFQEAVDRLPPDYSVNNSTVLEERVNNFCDDFCDEEELTNRNSRSIEVENNKAQEDENQFLRQLIESQQSGKHWRNETAQWKDRFTALTRQLEDNKLMDELQEVKQKYSNLTIASNQLESGMKTLKEQCAWLEGDKHALELKCAELESSLSDTQNKLSVTEHKLVDLTEKYMKCCEKQNSLANLAEKLKSEKTSAHALDFNILLCAIAVLLALTIAFYPTLAFFLGTADQPAERKKTGMNEPEVLRFSA